MMTDLRYAVRSLLTTSGFTVVALVTLALGIGAATAIFSVVNGVLLQPLPYAQPEQLARLCAEFPSYPNGGIHRFAISTPEYLYFQRELKSWRSVEAWSTSGVNLATAAEPVRITGASVTGGLFSSLGVAPASGRIISPADDMPGAAPVAVVSYGLWQRLFAGDRAVLGRRITLNGNPHTIIGVMPKGFGFPLDEPDAPEVWSALQVDPATAQFTGHNLKALGRLKSGVTLSQAQAELDTLVKNSVATSPGHHFDVKDHTLATYGLQDDVVHDVRPALRILFGAVFFLLLIACVNVANLFLARTEARQREIAVRSALGAGMGRLARQFVTEGLLVSFTGSALGLALAYGAMKLVAAARGMGLPRVDQIAIDSTVLWFAVAIGCVTGLVFGLTPLIHAVRQNVYGVIKTASTSPGANRFRQILVVSQIALALVLLTGTGLMLRAFWKTREIDAGFNPQGVTTLFTQLPFTVYPGESTRMFWTKLDDGLTAIPGVESASLSGTLPPVFDNGIGYGVWIDGFNPSERAAFPTASTSDGPIPLVDRLQAVNPGYFGALRIRLAAGRFFDSRDGAQASKAAIINQSMARTVWGNENALGRRIRPGGIKEWYTVVGVIADVKNNGIDQPTGTELYLNFSQAPAYMLYAVHVAVRSQSAPAAIIGAVRQTVHDIDPALPLTKVRTMDEVMAETQSRPRFLTLLLTLFAGVAVVLAAVGIYGVVSYSIAQRTREFGIRMALGAQRGNVMRLVLRRALWLIISGIVLGVGGSFAVTRLLSGFLFGITSTDPATYTATSLLLALVAVVACWIPARRATKVDPLVALRDN